MSVFGSDLNIGQEVLARGKRGKIDGVMFSAAGLSYRVVFPAETSSGAGAFFGAVEMFSAADVSPAAPRRPYAMLHLDGMYAVMYQTKADLDDAAESVKMQGRPHLQWVWCPAQKHYIGCEACRVWRVGMIPTASCWCCHQTKANLP